MYNTFEQCHDKFYNSFHGSNNNLNNEQNAHRQKRNNNRQESSKISKNKIKNEQSFSIRKSFYISSFKCESFQKNCKFGINCVKDGCKYQHPNQESQIYRKFNEDCIKKNNSINKICYHGQFCKFQNCKYQHLENEEQKFKSDNLQIKNSSNKLQEQINCHWYDLFGKICESGTCKKNHNFYPSFCCKWKNQGKYCQEELPNGVQLFLQKKLKKNGNLIYNCNDQNINKSIQNECHEFWVTGECKKQFCFRCHKKGNGICPYDNKNECKICNKNNLNENVKKESQDIINELQQKLTYNHDKMQTWLQADKESIDKLRSSNIDASYKTDLMFIVDCTGSMQKWIDYVCDKIKSIIQSVKKIFPNLDLRYSFVGYRDYEDEQVQNIKFTSNIDDLIQGVQKVKAAGGEDIPEDMPSGFQQALQMGFSSNIKVAYLFFDAPPHGQKYHDLSRIQDRYYENPKHELEPYVSQFACKRIYLNLIVLNEVANKTADIIERIYHLDNKQNYVQRFNSRQDPISSIDNFIKTSLMTSIQSSQIMGENRFHILNPVIEKIRQQKKIEVEMHITNIYIRSFKFLYDWKNPQYVVEESSFQYQVEITDEIGSGSLRQAFQAYDKTLSKQLVVKFNTLINKNQQDNFKEMIEQVKTQEVTCFIVNKFKGYILPHVNDLNSIPQCIVSKLGMFQLDKQIHFCFIEQRLENFNKFSDNNGFQTLATTEKELLLECLPHFSYQYTQGILLVTDIQGNNNIITDPCIHSRGEYKNCFGLTNLGTNGIQKFFKNHRCNKFCEALKLTSPQKYIDYILIDFNQKPQMNKQDLLQKIRNQQSSKFFCNICENEKKVEIQGKNEYQLLNMLCDQCSQSMKKSNYKCKQCKIEYEESTYWIKQRRGKKTENCIDCNRLEALKNIKQSYLQKK